MGGGGVTNVEKENLRKGWRGEGREKRIAERRGRGRDKGREDYCVREKKR